jgi:hypothetical protein
MTRKARKSRKNKSQRRRYKIKGGAFLAAGLAKKVGSKMGSVAQRIPGLRSLPPPEKQYSIEKRGTDLNDVWQVLKFSLGAIIMSPLYIGTVLANLPLNTIHNLSGKKISERHSDAVGIQLYKYMFEGYKLDPKKMTLDVKLKDQAKFFVNPGVTIKKSTIAKCDNCQSGGGVQRGGYMNTFKTFDEIMGFKPFNGIKGLVEEMTIEKYKEEITKNVAYQRKQVLHKLRELEFEVDSIKEDFDTRKPILKKNIENLRTEILFKCIVVCQTLIDKCEEFKGKKQVTVNKDMVVVSNPYRRKDKDSSHFKMEVCFLHDNCKSECPNCALFDNMISVYHSYARILLNILRGKNNNLYVIIDLLFAILKSALGKKKPAIDLDNFETMKYEGKPEQIEEILKNLKAPVKDTTKEPDPEKTETKDEEPIRDPIVMFKQLICEYGIYDEIKMVFQKRVDQVKPDEHQKNLLLERLNSIT